MSTGHCNSVVLNMTFLKNLGKMKFWCPKANFGGLSVGAFSREGTFIRIWYLIFLPWLMLRKVAGFLLSLMALYLYKRL